MCGRFALYASENEIVSHFSLGRGFAMRPRYNIFPNQMIPIILPERKQMEFAKWGDQGYFNIRLETLESKPTFRKTQFCLIPASGYYEWRNFSGKKQPFFVSHSQKKLFALAAVLSSHQTCSLVTLPAQGDLLKLHERMPLALPLEEYTDWHEGKWRTVDSGWIKDFSFYPVSPSMNNPQFESISCIHPL